MCVSEGEHLCALLSIVCWYCNQSLCCHVNSPDGQISRSNKATNYVLKQIQTQTHIHSPTTCWVCWYGLNMHLRVSQTTWVWRCSCESRSGQKYCSVLCLLHLIEIFGVRLVVRHETKLCFFQFFKRCSRHNKNLCCKIK